MKSMRWLKPAFALLVIFFLGGTASAQGTIFLVRHAERADTASGTPPTMAADPSLSEVGHARAASLAAMLRDAGITAIFVTEFKRTQETAAPLAKALGIVTMMVAQKDTDTLIARLRQTTGNALVVGHSNTVPEIAKALGVTTPITIGDDDYDNLLLVTPGQPARLVHLHYR
jgi:phosphohistidine phosphatase SixA